MQVNKTATCCSNSRCIYTSDLRVTITSSTRTKTPLSGSIMQMRMRSTAAPRGNIPTASAHSGPPYHITFDVPGCQVIRNGHPPSVPCSKSTARVKVSAQSPPQSTYAYAPSIHACHNYLVTLITTPTPATITETYQTFSCRCAKAEH